ncbi:3 beta-hydroxysteroid dehydrogenase/Delta 5--_4-isomerase [bacterium BMS3Abin02]|nr:3 beta-hydroxysteroid dehydrogenase/Delta 5-->4-isomerase [bacterium BMS3Abin02]GBE23474.1 3 beta-hydroxysteroid dehydrogenase/Delta 5-->4-isomerase [bacterium BMS3Bbin01]
MKVLVTGATGYIGGRLVPRLLERGFQVRCMTRDPARLTLDPWRDQVEVVAADALEPDTLRVALSGCNAAYYLIHGMEASEEYVELDRIAAENFRDAADEAGLERIIFLGGLGSDDDELSMHLRSRHEVGRILASGSTPVTEFRAAVIIGSGSMSFEMIRHLTEVLPVMMRPKWICTRCQPIAVRNVLEILMDALDFVGSGSRIYEIGGPDVLTYEEMMQTYAEVAGLPRRRVIPLPLFSSRLSPLLVGLVTPLPVATARPLIESLLNDVVVTRESPPGYQPADLLTYREAVWRAMARILQFEVETRWSDALTKPAQPLPGDPVWSGAAMELDRRAATSSAPADDVFWAVSRIGGDVGYYTMNWAWRFRGLFDRLIGGVGLRRGRRHPEELRPGEALDFFRVVIIDPEQRHLLLRAEMKVPGTAWLEWTVEPTDEGSRLTQIARFVPRGVVGRLYWWAMLPFHAPIFRRMARRITRVAEQRESLQVGQ